MNAATVHVHSKRMMNRAIAANAPNSGAISIHERFKMKFDTVSLAGAVFTLFVVNYAWTSVTGRPAPMCLVEWAVKPVFAPWYTLMLPALTAGLLYVLVAGKGFRVTCGVVLLMVLVAGLPDFYKTVGLLGKAC